MSDIAIKAIITLMITMFSNKILSTLRVRQLYLAAEQILDCHDINVEGYTASITVFNKGKDKEKGIEIIFPATTFCQVISQSQSGISYEKNIIKIDRLAPKEKLSLMVFVKGHNKINKKNLPTIKSEDTRGRSFWGAENVWPSLGPAVLSLSFVIGLFALGGYATWSGQNLHQTFFKARYHGIYQQGFLPSIISDNYIASKLPFFDQKLPITVDPLYVKDKMIYFPVHVTNTEKNPQKIEASISGIDIKYYREITQITVYGDNSEDAKQSLREKFSVPKNYWSSEEFTINPGETKTLIYKREITPNLKLSNISVEISIKGKDEAGGYYSDFYNYTPKSHKELPLELKLSE
ncbi:hypothetical protein N5D52_10075 [Pseudomonas sp. GD03860]|uniref:hypothetical protein n=1 Tax=Pseudomonas sp. GD03860 TaxID=2975389 RepID=UPI0024488827|nr:hypothetical protein [Pseudomonas sp. GD03860]MDH0637289.1 hypothetical protein [Pseudomonas sp. GD03860]